jgi:hypothetical protein
MLKKLGGRALFHLQLFGRLIYYSICLVEPCRNEGDGGSRLHCTQARGLQSGCTCVVRESEAFCPTATQTAFSMPPTQTYMKRIRNWVRCCPLHASMHGCMHAAVSNHLISVFARYLMSWLTQELATSSWQVSPARLLLDLTHGERSCSHDTPSQHTHTHTHSHNNCTTLNPPSSQARILLTPQPHWRLRAMRPCAITRCARTHRD